MDGDGVGEDASPFSTRTGMNCIKIGLPRKFILRDYFQENMTSRGPFLLPRISFPRIPILIQLPPGSLPRDYHEYLLKAAEEETEIQIQLQ